MTVKELIQKLEQEDPEAIVYQMNVGDDIALIVTEVKRDVLESRDKTVTIC